MTRACNDVDIEGPCPFGPSDRPHRNGCPHRRGFPIKAHRFTVRSVVSFSRGIGDGGGASVSLASALLSTLSFNPASPASCPVRPPIGPSRSLPIITATKIGRRAPTVRHGTVPLMPTSTTAHHTSPQVSAPPTTQNRTVASPSPTVSNAGSIIALRRPLRGHPSAFDDDCS